MGIWSLMRCAVFAEGTSEADELDRRIRLGCTDLKDEALSALSVSRTVSKSACTRLARRWRAAAVSSPARFALMGTDVARSCRALQSAGAVVPHQLRSPTHLLDGHAAHERPCDLKGV